MSAEPSERRSVDQFDYIVGLHTAEIKIRSIHGKTSTHIDTESDARQSMEDTSIVAYVRHRHMAAGLCHSVAYKGFITCGTECAALFFRRCPASDKQIADCRWRYIGHHRSKLRRNHRQQVDRGNVVGQSYLVADRKLNQPASCFESTHHHHFPGYIVGGKRAGKHRRFVNAEKSIACPCRSPHIFLAQLYVLWNAGRA